MKKYKRILAGFLAMNLTISGMLADAPGVSASEESYNNENSDIAVEEIQEFSAEKEAVSVAENEDNAGSEDIGESYDTIESEDAIESEDSVDTDSTEGITDIEETEDMSETEESNNSDEEISGEEEQIIGEEETELESETESETDEIAAQSSVEAYTGKLDLKQLKGYEEKDGQKIFTAKDRTALILLSNCPSEEIQDITINLNITGGSDITEKSKIAAGTDISQYFKSGNTVAVVSEEEDTQAAAEDTLLSVQSDTEQESSAEVMDLEKTDDADEEQSADIPMQESNSGVQAQTITATQEYTFQGIGSVDHPFQGRITGQNIKLFIDRPFFGGLSSKANIFDGKSKLQLVWCGDETEAMAAELYQFDSVEANGHTLPVTISRDEAEDTAAVMGSLIDTVKAAHGFENEILNIGKEDVTYEGKNSSKVAVSSDNAGLICNTLESGNICLDNYDVPTKIDRIESTAEYQADDASKAGNAGGIIGVMGKNTSLHIKTAVSIPDKIEVVSQNGNAGGLAGLMLQGAKIITNADVGLTAPQISGGTSAGGIAGAAEDVILADGDMTSEITVSDATITGSKENAKVGGFVGAYTLNEVNLSENQQELELPNQVKINSPKLTVNQNYTGAAGGYFGILNLNGTLAYTIDGTDANAKKEIKPTYQGCSVTACGAIAGQVTSSTIAGTLRIQNVKTSSTYSSSDSKFHGGLIGEVGGMNEESKAVYLEVSNVEISENTPQANDGHEDNGFGGLAGRLEQGSILKTTDTVKISTSGDINRGGGLVGYADKSVINIAGTTDLSGVTYGNGTGKDAKTGWLVGRQDCALIYANGDGNGNGWTYIRGKEKTSGKQAMNDIGNYGQIIRLHSGTSTSKLSTDLIKINDTHAIEYKETVDGNSIALKSEDEFALLSIAWNSRGYFGGVAGITSANFSSSNPKNKNITLNADIDLTGSGITGLTRDLSSTEDTYSGIFNGQNYTITLVSGETFGYAQNAQKLASDGEDGFGEVIAAGPDNVKYHGRQGLFATVTDATIQNLTIAGSISISNAGKDIPAGGIAGEIGDGTPKIFGVTVEETISADSAVNEIIVVGGFFGGSYKSKGGVVFQKGDRQNTAAAKINMNNCTATTDDTKVNAGGLIGEVGESAFRMEAENLMVNGSITTDAKKRAYVGGLIGIIKGREDDPNNHNIEIKNVTFDGFKIDAPAVTEVCGGLFGSIWANVEVYFRNNDDSTKLTVKNNTVIDAQKANSVGGLAYRSSGKWEIQDQGINLKSLTVEAKKDVGLLVCKGERAADTIAGGSRYIGALYLSTTKYWGNSYNISENGVKITTSANGVFDEFVAYTTSAADKISDNNVNGIISIATEEGADGRVGVDISGCTTYQNRTVYGKSHNTNSYSRYYYDLDQCLADAAKDNATKNNSKLDTPQELMLWSVYNYARANIKNYFTQIGTDGEKLTDITTVPRNSNNVTLPWSIGNTTCLNLEKYSYYPIKCELGSVNVIDTELIFNNKKIEDAEENNKSTQGTPSSHTQHYTMHCGLFLTYQSSPRGTLTVSNVTFSGNIGKVNNNSSGVLISDFATGSYDGSTERPITINIRNITLNGLKVNNCNEDYAPLLINNIGNRSSTSYKYGYATLTVDGAAVKGYEEGTAVASSLIGTVGSDKSQKINMTFQNIKLPDKKAQGKEGIFSHATLLEHFSYDPTDSASGATYNFYKIDDWKDGKNKYNVTYGKEITGSTEFTDLQKWYYDEAAYGTEDGLVYEDANKKTEFDASKYLPYVCVAYDKAKNTHEIKVNQRVINIVNGCGTYGHPYRITKEAEMNILAEYMATGQPRKDWRVTVTADPNTVHAAKSKTDYTSDKDVTYQYNGNGYWVQVKNKATDGKDDWQPVSGNIQMGRDFMRDYLLNAYYDIRGTVEQGSDAAEGGESAASVTSQKLVLKNFKGFGTETNPFRGVITSTNGAILVLDGEETGNGLIPYSYGSVVKDLKISYTGTGKTLTRGTNTTTTFNPGVFFGGVIGCVLGGDNMIDNVEVDIGKNYLTLAGDKKHLIQAGGYVGSVSGGGVIFRNMDGKAGLTDNAISGASVVGNAHSSLYVNPYVGRVLDGFAFYEADSKEKKLENGSKNYHISTIVKTDTDCVTANGNTITVNDAQGLLILSAVVNSGGASDGISNAYSRLGSPSDTVIQYTTSNKKTTYSFGGKYGKVRNASYNKIGNTDDDATLSNTEDKKLPGDDNLPYLIKTYCSNNAVIFRASENSEIEINLSENAASFDMSDYENGYQGIGGRYVSNAVRGQKEDGTSAIINRSEAIIPEVKSFNGNSRPVLTTMQVSEYTDDDFHAASVGGMFNILRVSSNGVISNLTIGQEQNPSVVSLEYYDSDGNPAHVSKDTWRSCEDVGVGGFAGSLVGYTDENANRDITMQKVQLNNLRITSPSSAGGIAGNTGKPTIYQVNTKSDSTEVAVLLQPQKSQITYGIAFNDCSYKDVQVTGKYASGGFAGYIGNTDQDPRSSVNGKGFNGTLTNVNIGESSTISATDSSSWAGSLFGYVGTRMFINMNDDGTEYNAAAILQDVAVSAGTAAGGCIGYINEKCYGIHNVAVKGTETVPVGIGITSNTKGTFYAGGIVGYAKGVAQSWIPNWTYAGGISNSSIENVQINNADIANKQDYSGSNKIQKNYIAGGMVGQAAGGKTRIEGCEVKSGKVYGSVSAGMAGQTDSQMEFSNCTSAGISESAMTDIKGFSTAGGILGFWTGKNAVMIQECNVQYLNIEGKDWGVGALVGDADGDGVGILYLFDSSVKDSKVTALGNSNDAGGRWPEIGSIIGNLRNTIKASNVLISDVALRAEKGIYSPGDGAPKGLLFGNVDGDDIAVNIAGISIQNIPDDNKDWNLAGAGNVTSENDYIAFADYSGTAEAASETSGAAPYVVTSPKTTLELYESETAEQAQDLYGDGVSWTPDSKSFTVKAQEIYANKGNVTKGHYAYKNINLSSDFDFTSVISTFLANQTTENKSDSTDQTESKDTSQESGQTTQKVTDFPVVQIGSGSDDVITDYLDILTNGAFSAANKMNKSGDVHVTAQTDLYEYKNSKFVKVGQNADAAPAFKVVTDNKSGKITFGTTTGYDNGKNRFNLLTVTFTEKDADGKEYKYNVFVPILVRRMLEMDFTATLTYGTDFNSADYQNLTNHVLESFGSSITGYLTYTYSSAAGVYADYGWESYINAGGDLTEMKKFIRFATTAGKLPKGTQMTLVDAATGSVYYYTASGSEQKVNNAGFDIPLSEFKNSDGKAYQEPSISELIDVNVSQKGSNLLFIEVDQTGAPVSDKADDKNYPKPTIRIKTKDEEGKEVYKYYRLAGTDETGTYSVTVDESKLKETKDNKTISKVTENYYLVVTVPKDAGSEALNGSIQMKVDSTIPHRENYKKIKESADSNGKITIVDNHENTASTYQLSSGYQQSLVETGNDGASKKITLTESTLKVDVTDTIKFPNSQAYNENDQLYLRFVGGLQKTVSDSTSAEQFPSGTSGTVNFYVYTQSGDSKTYYTYQEGEWKTANSETSVIKNPWTWTSAGGNMELLLSTDGTTDNALSLGAVRTMIKKANSGKETSAFCVEVRMDAVLPPAGLEVIPESSMAGSTSLPTDFAKLTFTSQISTVMQNLPYSSNQAAALHYSQGNTVSGMTTAYYRDEPTGVKLTYDADEMNQLGINLLDLQSEYLDNAKTHSLIDTTAGYDLSTMKNLEDTLKASGGIRFKLTLQPKGKEEKYDAALTKAEDYMSVELKSQGAESVSYANGTWSWTVPKKFYWENGQIKESSIFQSDHILRQAIQLKVNVTGMEKDGHLYSNYKVILTAEILDSKGNVIDNTPCSDNIIYTFAKIKPEFVN